MGSKLRSALRAAQDLERDGDEPLIPAHEALERVADGFLDTRATSGGSIPERYQVVVRADLDDLGECDAHIVDAGHIEPHELSELLCESYLSIIHERDAKPVAVADVRLATPAQRKALLVRDGGCRFPGCGRTRFLKAHHLVHHAHGGPTSIDNMILLCQAHHSTVHKPGWKVGFDDDGHLGFVSPDGVDRARPPGRPSPSTDPPPPGPRHTGTGERLDNFGADVIMHHWLRASGIG